MNNLRAAIDTLYRKVPPDQVIHSCYKPDIKRNYHESVWKESNIQQLLFDHLPGYSHTDIEHIWQKIAEDWGRNSENKQDEQVSVFHLLYHFSHQVLCQDRKEPVVEYQQLMRWRQLSHLLGEDLFTTCYLAYEDVVSRHQRMFFAWRPVIGSNNIRLKNMLQKGLAENHFHLQGSAPHCDISWLALMNKITNRRKQFNDFLQDGELEVTPSLGVGSHHHDLYVLTMKAAAIRVFLFKVLKGISIDKEGLLSEQGLRELLQPKSTSKESKWLISQLPILQRSIDVCREMYGYQLDKSMKVSRPDYWLGKDLDESNVNGNALLCGERIFLYECFKAIKCNKPEFTKYHDLFYTYLIIKSQFREEMIQLNPRVGFRNFELYQDRKMVFLEGRDIYHHAIYNMAVNTSRANQNIKSFEARVAPRDSVPDIKKHLHKMECDINTKVYTQANYSGVDRYLEKYQTNGGDKSENESLFYVHHFIKKKDKSKLKKPIEMAVGDMQCRHHQLRKEIQRQALSIAAFRSSTHELTNKLLGIDAAASELNTRPEVFAHAFRYLKHYRDKGQYNRFTENDPTPPLKSTFHAGEDFCDLVDGLRAIDEAIKFLELGEGDRLGHALALGIDPAEYYKSKHGTIMLPKQWHLDNLVWLISRVNKYNLYQFSTFSQYLRWEFQTLYNEIYQEMSVDEEGKAEAHVITPELYYEAWKLRGDDPFRYRAHDAHEEKQSITFWERCGENERYPDKGVIRKSRKVNRLYREYHFNAKVKKRGNEIKRFEVKSEYIKLVTEIQKQFQKEIAKRHLGIETNPSSNYLIGTFRRYDKHPLLKFYNLGLETDPEKIKSCPQLFVSINTDDQGVFNTYLENEYAIMALALEKMKDDNGEPLYHSAMIYDWLDRIRQMGLEMSFLKPNT